MPHPQGPSSAALAEADFSALVEEALAGIPAEFASYLANVTILVEEEPSAAVLRRLGLDPCKATLFGLYQGVPLTRRRHDHANTLPDHITIFRGPLLRACRTPAQLASEVRRTVVHEIGHFFGFDERRLRQLGY